MVSKSKADAIHRMPKVIEDDWEWEYAGGSLRGEAIVYCLDNDIVLNLKAWKRKSYGFSLVYRNSKIIRRWDDSVPHPNPDGVKIEEPHKHYWTDEHEDNFAYPTDDITQGDVDQAFWDFLEEEHIEMRGDYQETLTL